jgi:hypothetical protein
MSRLIVVEPRGFRPGVYVDRASESVTVANADLAPPPAFGAIPGLEHLLGDVRVGGCGRLLSASSASLRSA